MTSLIIEPTNTCNLTCSFCYVTEGMVRDEGFMDFDLFKKIVDETPGLEHLCMHNWGEPLLHPRIFEMLDYAKRSGVRWLVMNTNGTLLNEAMIDRIVGGSLDILRISIDGLDETYRRTRGVPLANLEEKVLRLLEQRDRQNSELQVGVVFTVEKNTEADADEFSRHWEGIVDHVRLQPRLAEGQRTVLCPELFGKDYGKLVVLWDGTVVPCCVDYNGILKLGNAWTQPVGELWRATAIERLRESHLKGEFPSRCANCNECETSKTEKRFIMPAYLVQGPGGDSVRANFIRA